MDTNIVFQTLIRCSKKGSFKMSINQKLTISQLLMKLGNVPNKKGFHYLKEGIRFCIKDPQSVTNLQKLIYPKIAEKYGTSPDAVERASRNSIKESWYRRDKEFARELFGNTLQCEAEVPSNSLYIAVVAEWASDDE